MTESANAQNLALEEIRLEIDAIDDQMCALLEQRFAVVERVRSIKSECAGTPDSPIRPAREAAVLDRLMNRPGRLVPAELKVHLWRAIISASTLQQAPITINVSAELGASVPLRLMIRDHFGSIPVAIHETEMSALVQLGHEPKDLCIVAPGSDWAYSFLAGAAGDAQVIGCLPFLRRHSVPELLILGHAKPEPTGHDETVLISNGSLDADHMPSLVWQVSSGGCLVTALSGFQTMGPKVAGHYAIRTGVGS